MKDDVGYEEFLAAVYEVIEEREKSELKDLKQQIELLTMIMKSAMIETGKTKGRKGISSPRKKELLGSSPQKRMQGSPKKGKISLRPGQNLFSVLDVSAGVMDGVSVQLQKTSIGEN